MLSLLLLMMMMMVVAVLLPNMCTMTMRSFLGRPSRTHQAIPVFESLSLDKQNDVYLYFF